MGQCSPLFKHSTCKAVGLPNLFLAVILVVHQLTHHDVSISQVMGKREDRKPHNPCENQRMACIRRIPKNRIPDFDPESRTQSLNCDVINKSSNENFKHRHMLAFQLHLLYDNRFPSPTFIQVQVLRSSNLHSNCKTY
jgi:hypothetical protein